MQEVVAPGERVGDAWQSRGSLWGPSVGAGSLLHVQVQVSLLVLYCTVLDDTQMCSAYSREGRTLEDPEEDIVLEMQVSNSTTLRHTVDLSISCHGGNTSGNLLGPASDPSMAMTSGQVTGAQSTLHLTCPQAAYDACLLALVLMHVWHLLQPTLNLYGQVLRICLPAGLHVEVDQCGQAASHLAVTFFHPGIYCLSATDMRAKLLDSPGVGHANVAVYPLFIHVR